MTGRFRIGHGYDVHAFEPGDSITLGGVKIAYPRKLKAHSDGDVLIHAIMDAALGALAAGDIGRHFPDTDPQFNGIDSRLLLRRVSRLLLQQGWQVSNIDATVIAERPRLAPYIDRMRRYIATDLNTPQQSVNIKATTTESLGYIGRGEGIATHAVICIYQS